MAEHNAYKKYMESEKKTRSAAIKAMCANCMGCTLEHLEPGYRDSIRNCTAPQCPLYPFRPYQEKVNVIDASSDT